MVRYTLLTASGCGNLSAFSFQPNSCLTSKAQPNQTLTIALRPLSSSIQPKVLQEAYSYVTSQKLTLSKYQNQPSPKQLLTTRVVKGNKTIPINSKCRARSDLKRPRQARRQCFQLKLLAVKSSWADNSRPSLEDLYAGKTQVATLKTTILLKVSTPCLDPREFNHYYGLDC